MGDIFENLGDRELQRRDERRQAVGLLLASPFVTDDGPEVAAFALVRRHADALREWFRHHLGYRLVVDHEFARLYKRSPPSAEGRWEDRPRGASWGAAQRPFDRRRYAILCLVLAALEKVETDQTILSELAVAVRDLATDTEGVTPLDLEQPGERRRFVDALLLLVDYGILARTDGNEGGYVRQGKGDALYDIDSRRLTQMLASPMPPSLAEHPRDLAEESYAPTPDGKNDRLRHRLMRHMVEQPVLYFDSLDEDERGYFNAVRPRLIDQIETWTPLTVEVRREGVVTIDDSGRCSDLRFPGQRHVDHAALLIADALARRCGKPSATAPAERLIVARADLLQAAVRLLQTHSWRAAYRDDASGATLLDDALSVLADLGLVRRHSEGVEPLPALFRFRYVEPSTEANL